MTAYLDGHVIVRHGRAGRFWWTIDDRSEEFGSLGAAIDAIGSGSRHAPIAA